MEVGSGGYKFIVGSWNSPTTRRRMCGLFPFDVTSISVETVFSAIDDHPLLLFTQAFRFFCFVLPHIDESDFHTLVSF